jgi:hypothetical protein
MVPDRGNGGRWGVVIALVGVLLSGAALARPDDGEINYHSPSGLAHAENKNANPSASLQYQDPRQTGGYQADCSKPKRAEDSDLCAQWGAVESVRDANAIARRQLRWTVAEFFALVATLLITALATVAATRAAKSAQDSVHSERAWMCFSGPRYNEINNGTIKGRPYNEGLAISIHWLNAGRSPAVEIDIVRDYAWVCG